MADTASPSRRFRTGLGLGAAFIVGVLAFVITLELFNIVRPAPNERIEPPDRRPAASELTYPFLNADISGPSTENWSLKAQEGKPVIVNYFATWCGPCMEEMPDLSALSQEFAPHGVVTVAVCLDHDNDIKQGISRLDALRRFSSNHKLPFPILLPVEHSPLMEATLPIPQTVLYDRHGRIARLIPGTIKPASLRQNLEELLKEN